MKLLEENLREVLQDNNVEFFFFIRYPKKRHYVQTTKNYSTM